MPVAIGRRHGICQTGPDREASMRPSVYTNVLDRAARILGGQDKLRDFLKVRDSQLNAWLGGAAKPPTDIFLKVVDIVSQESLHRLSEVYRKSELRLQAAQHAY